jgi:HSP20 family protein
MAIVKRTNGVPTFSTLLSDLVNADRFFSNDLISTNWVPAIPAVNVAETNHHYEVELSAPGYKKDDFKVDVTNDILNISAETSEEKEEKDKDYTRREFSASSFSRSFSLPENAKQDDIEAKYEHGILKLKLAKKHAETPKRKEVKVG